MDRLGGLPWGAKGWSTPIWVETADAVPRPKHGGRSGTLERLRVLLGNYIQ